MLTALIDAIALADGAPALARLVSPHASEVVAAFAEHAPPDLTGATAAAGARTLRLQVAEPAGRADGFLRTQCTGDWILWLRPGEAPAPELLRSLPSLLGDRAFTHYRLPLPGGGSGARLVRNEPAALRFGAAGGPEALGPHRSLEHGLVQAKAVAPDVAEPLVPPLAGAEEIDAHWPLRLLPPASYAARLELVESDLRFDAGGGRVLHVALENRGRVPWLWGSRICVSYRWLHESGASIAGEGLRTPLPGPLAPGERTVVPVSIAAPAAGSYVLEVDAVDEGVKWFERPLRVPVAVT